MRTAVLMTIALGAVASPAGAQVQSKISILNGDTLVTIERGSKNTCTVKIGERTLAESAAKPICDARQHNVVFLQEDLSDQVVHLRELGNRLRSEINLPSESLAQLQRQHLDMARELQSRSLALSREGADLALRSRELGNLRVFENPMGVLAGDRGFIGVTVDPRPRDTDRHGAYIVAVTPNYPADKAGLKAGDIIVSIDGKSLTRGSTERSVSADESLPWIRLTEVVGKLEPGKQVPLEYRREDRNRSTRITPVADSRWLVQAPPTGVWTTEGNRLAIAPGVRGGLFTETPDMPSPPRFSGTYSFGLDSARLPMRTYNDAAGFAFTFGGPLADLELVAVNPRLGETFGTSRGVLVVDAPAKGNLGLKPGDVVTAVDGRTVDTPSELIRVLRTYDRDKSFTLTVVREKQRQSINTKLGNAEPESGTLRGTGARQP